jgi:hypothetical protein
LELLRNTFHVHTYTITFLFYYYMGTVAQRLEQVVLKLSFKGQSKLTSYTFNVRVVGSNPTCSTINGQLKLTSENWYSGSSPASFKIIINKNRGSRLTYFFQSDNLLVNPLHSNFRSSVSYFKIF